MSDSEVLEELIARARETKAQCARLSDAAHILGGRFIELGRALENETPLRPEFPFDYCDVAEASRLLRELPELRSALANLEFRIKRRTALD